MIIFDENNLSDYFLESNDISYIYCRPKENNYNKTWNILFVLGAGKSSIEWEYKTKEQQLHAIEKLKKTLKIQTINTLSL